MKLLTLLAGSALSATVLAGTTNQFQLKSSAMNTAGGALTGDRFSLSATIGQAEAAPALSNGPFRLEPGFWTGITLQQDGSVQLRMRLLPGGFAVISWPIAYTGWILEETDNVVGGAWQAVARPVIATETEQTVTVGAAGVIKVFRLRKIQD